MFSISPSLIPKKEIIQDERMLFVRTDGIIETMVNAPLIFAGLIIMSLMIPIHNSFASTRSLDLIIYPDGSTHISTEIDVDSLESNFSVDLFGQSIDNFVVSDDSGFLLYNEITDNKAIVDTFGTSFITIDYDVHDLISKEGRVWTFSFDSSSDYSLLMPSNSIIVGMNILPKNMEIINDQTKFELSNGLSEINYVFGTSTPIETTSRPNSSIDYSIITIITGLAIAGIIAGIIAIKRKQQKPSTKLLTEIKPTTKLSDIESIFKLNPEMRDDDKEIVKFISDNDGQVLESDLRKKFLQPRTTMWRAVKRLERLEVIEITKKDLQNLIKLKIDTEKENE